MNFPGLLEGTGGRRSFLIFLRKGILPSLSFTFQITYSLENSIESRLDKCNRKK